MKPFQQQRKFVHLKKKQLKQNKWFWYVSDSKYFRTFVTFFNSGILYEKYLVIGIDATKFLVKVEVCLP